VLARTPAVGGAVGDDLAGIAVFLAGRASDFVTGTAIPVDGGYSARVERSRLVRHRDERLGPARAARDGPARCASVVPLDNGRCPARADASPPLRRGHLRLSHESRTKNHDKPDLYANTAFVMARAVTQFHRFAPSIGAPRLSPQAYTQRVEQVTAYSPWDDPLPADRRVVIPGYASLHELSAEQEAVVKAGLRAGSGRSCTGPTGASSFPSRAGIRSAWRAR